MVHYDFETGTLEFTTRSKTPAPLVLDKRQTSIPRGRVLVCDFSGKDSHITEVYGFALENMEYKVTAVDSLPSLLEQISKINYDFIVMNAAEDSEDCLNKMDQAINYRSKSVSSAKTKVITFGDDGSSKSAKQFTKISCLVKWSKDATLDEILENIQVDMMDVQHRELYAQSRQRMRAAGAGESLSY